MAMTQSTTKERTSKQVNNPKTPWRPDPLAILALVLAAAALALFFWKVGMGGQSRKVGFVDTQRLLVGFNDANKVNKELESEDTKWKASLKAMEDSLKAHMDSMSVKFDAADAKSRRVMQDELSARNQQVNNFQRFHTQRMQQLTQEKMKAVYAKIDVFMKEFGASKGYDIIFGTVSGSILYGEGTPADITNQVLEQLSKRYE